MSDEHGPLCMGMCCMYPTEWQPITTVPAQKVMNPPHEVLLYGRRVGIRTGTAANYGGYLYAGVAFINGNLIESGHVTHWMPLPSPPAGSEAAATQPTEEQRCDS